MASGRIRGGYALRGARRAPRPSLQRFDAMSASPLVRASALGAIPTSAPRPPPQPGGQHTPPREVCSCALRPRPRPRRATTAAGMSDPGYWDNITAIMTPNVTVDLSPPSLAALAIGGVLVLGHSWESLEASKGWRESRDRARAAAAEPGSNSAPNSASNSAPNSAPVRTARARPMSAEEREAAAAEARAARVLAAAAVRAAMDFPSPSPSREAAILDVCTNAACAKLGAKDLMANLVEVRERAGLPCEIRRSRCLDACGAGCVVRARGARGLTTEYHVGDDEAVELLEVATGRAIEDAPKPTRA